MYYTFSSSKLWNAYLFFFYQLMGQIREWNVIHWGWRKVATRPLYYASSKVLFICYLRHIFCNECSQVFFIFHFLYFFFTKLIFSQCPIQGEAAWATALVLVLLERKFDDQRDQWTLLATKARTFIAGCGEQVEELLAKACLSLDSKWDLQ